MKGTPEGSGIVQVEGGHILRSTGRKDRHSKVYTSKGPRDRRVRLAAHTAIQFYDVQDRLGYDRPSKAVDWLIKKAQTAIDNLNELAPVTGSNPSSHELALCHPSETQSHYYPLIQPNSNPGCSNSSFMAAPGEEEHDINLINTMKSFFPTTNFPDFSSDDSVSRASFPTEDLGLSLHSFQGNSNNFQGSFQRVDGWSNGGDMDHRVGFLMTSPESTQQAAAFPHRELPQSNLAGNSWNQRLLASADQNNPQASVFGSPFELGFRVPARIYGDEEADNHR